jgi:hypothetical protein
VSRLFAALLALSMSGAPALAPTAAAADTLGGNLSVGPDRAVVTNLSTVAVDVTVTTEAHTGITPATYSLAPGASQLSLFGRSFCGWYVTATLQPQGYPNAVSLSTYWPCATGKHHWLFGG